MQPDRPAGRHSAPSSVQHGLIRQALRTHSDPKLLLVIPESAISSWKVCLVPMPCIGHGVMQSGFQSGLIACHLMMLILQELALGPCQAVCDEGAALLAQHSGLTRLVLHHKKLTEQLPPWTPPYTPKPFTAGLSSPSWHHPSPRQSTPL